MTPNDRRYTSQHQWVSKSDNGLFVVGITDFAQDQLGPVVYVELPDLGEELEEGEPYGVVESAKSSSDLFTPLDCEVVETNTSLEDEPEAVNDDPYGDGWMLKVRPVQEDGYDRLVTAADYAAMVGE